MSRTAWILTGLVLIAAAATVWPLTSLIEGTENDELGSYSGFWQLVVAVVALAVALIGLIRDLQPREDRFPLDGLADRLAVAVGEQCRREATDRGLVEPAPIDVHWRRVAGFGPPGTAAAAPAPFVPVLPGSGSGSGRARGGTVSELYPVYAEQRRLMILGPAGAGKSASAALLVSAALAARGGVRHPSERAAIPVPVLLTAADWATDRPVTDWIVALLRSTYRGLPGGSSGDRLLSE